MIRGNEINSALTINELQKKKKKKTKKKQKTKLIRNSIQIYNEAKAVIYKQNGATIYIVAKRGNEIKKKRKEKEEGTIT
jgi:hypothetical protein